MPTSVEAKSNDNILSLLQEIESIANFLKDLETYDLLQTIKHQIGKSKLQLLVVGSSGTGRFSVANSLLEQPVFLPPSSIPRAAVSIDVSHGEALSIEADYSDRNRASIPFDELKSFLTKKIEETSDCTRINIKANFEILKNINLYVEDIGVERSVIDWKELLAKSDYVFLILRSTALLAERERQFIKEILQPNFGLERVTIVLNHIDLVPDDERSSISELVRTFLGTFESQPLLLEFSAIQARKAMEVGNPLSNSNYSTLHSLIQSNLIERQTSLKASAIQQAIEICLQQIAARANRQKAIFLVDETDIQKALNKIEQQNHWIQKRIHNSHNKIELYLNTLLKEELFQEIEGFSRALQKQISKEVLPMENITIIKKHLPGYLEAVWGEFFQSQLLEIKNKLLTEIKQIRSTVEEELKALIVDEEIDFSNLLDEFNVFPASLSNFLMPKRSKDQVGLVATGLQLSGFLLLITNLPLGLAALGSGQIIRILNKKGMVAADKQAIQNSVDEAILDLENHIKQQIQAEFTELTNKLKAETTNLYNTGIARVRSSLEQSLESYQEIKANGKQIEYLLNVTIPALRERLATME